MNSDFTSRLNTKSLFKMFSYQSASSNKSDWSDLHPKRKINTSIVEHITYDLYKDDFWLQFWPKKRDISFKIFKNVHQQLSIAIFALVTTILPTMHRCLPITLRGIPVVWLFWKWRTRMKSLFVNVSLLTIFTWTNIRHILCLKMTNNFFVNIERWWKRIFISNSMQKCLVVCSRKNCPKLII